MNRIGNAVSAAADARRAVAIALVVAAAAIATGCETISRAVVGGEGSRDALIENRSTAANIAGNDRVSDLTAALPGCDGAPGCLSVMTFNLKHRDVPVQLHAVARQLQAEPATLPDFLLLQEVVFDRPRSRGHDNTAAALAQLLGYHCRGAARDGGAEGLAILSRHQFVFDDHLHLNARDSLMSGGFPRVSTMGEFEVDGMGLVRVVNVHLTQRPSQNDIRRAQLQETLDWAASRQREQPADVVIIGGDFNIEPGWSELSLMNGDASSAAGDGIAFLDANTAAPTSGKVGDSYLRVDYIFIAAPRHDAACAGEVVLWPRGIPTVDGRSHFWPSDHRPLLHVYRLSPR